MPLTIKTDHKWKDFKYGYELPDKVMADQFDHLDDDAKFDGFIKYRGRWYHTSDFMSFTDAPSFKGWHGYLGHSFFSGVVIKLSQDGEQYQIGTYFS